MAGRSYSYYAHMARRPDLVHGFACAFGDERGGGGGGGARAIHVWGSNTLRCPGMALRFAAVIDCTPAKDRDPPVTIAFVKNSGEPGGGGAVAEFTLDACDFVLIWRRREFEAMVQDAGFPPECAAVVEDFCIRSATMAINSFYRGVAITVEIAPPQASNAGDGDGDCGEEEEVEEEECPICLRKLVVGSAEVLQLSCSHAFHRACLDKWVSTKKRTCPYCRSPVPEGIEILLYGDDEPELGDDGYDSGELPPLHGAA